MKTFWLALGFIVIMLYATAASAELLVLFDEDNKTEAGKGDFVGLFSNHDAASTVTVTKDEAFLGKVSVFTTPAQSYNSNMAGWNFPIRENPGKGEYRYIYFAWKADGGTGVMIQFPDNGGWGAVTAPCVKPTAVGTRRYIAGTNVTGWTGICVSDKIPKEWTVVQRDLFDDFGEWTMTGLALTPFSDGGKGDYYDAIMLAAKENEFPVLAVDAKGKIAVTWGNLKANRIIGESHR